MSTCAHNSSHEASFIHTCDFCGYEVCANCKAYETNCPSPRYICAHNCSRGARLSKHCTPCGNCLCDSHYSDDCPKKPVATPSEMAY